MNNNKPTLGLFNNNKPLQGYFMLGYVAHWRCVMYLTDNLLSGGLSRG